MNVLFFGRKPASPEPRTKTLWVYDLRTNKHFCLKPTRSSGRTSTSSSPATTPTTATTARRRGASRTQAAGGGAILNEAILQRDKVSLEISSIPDESLQDSASLPDPDEIAAEIVEDLRAALEEFEMIQEDLARP